MQRGILSYEKHIQEGSITVEQTYLTQNPVITNILYVNNNSPDVMEVRADYLVKAQQHGK